MYRPLTPDEKLDKYVTDTWEQVMARVYKSLGSQVLPRELEDIALENTPWYDPCEDEIQNEQTFPQIAEKQVGAQYIGAEIMLPVGNEMAWGHLVTWSHNSSGNIMSRDHASPIMDTRQYQVEFKGGKVTE